MKRQCPLLLHFTGILTSYQTRYWWWWWWWWFNYHL